MTNATDSVLSVVGSVSVDLLGVLIACAAVFFLGSVKGKDSVLIFLFSLYPAALIADVFPFYSTVVGGGVTEHIASIAVFVVTAGASAFVLSEIIDTNYQPSTLWRWVEIAVFSVLSVGLSIALLCEYAGLHHVYAFSDLFHLLFVSGPYALLAWVLMPFIALSLFEKV